LILESTASIKARGMTKAMMKRMIGRDSKKSMERLRLALQNAMAASPPAAAESETIGTSA
jgi:hypothetical protein